MTSLKNRVQLVGNLGNTPEVKTLDNGNKVAKFSLATNEVYSSGNGQQKEITQWHNIVAWGKNAEIVEKNLTKGKEIAIEGRITYKSYEDKNKQTKYYTEIVLNQFVLFPGKQ